MKIANNIPALSSQLSMRRADRALNSAMMRLASGIRINSAREDAAGLAIANKLGRQVSGLNQASDNSTHGISLVQTAEGALNEIHNMLQRMRELAVQAAHDTLDARQKTMIQMEIDQLTAEIHAISTRTEFNRIRLLAGEADRVHEMFRIDDPTTDPPLRTLLRNMVTPVFVSPEVGPGQFDFTIDEVGRHAYVPFRHPTSGAPAQGESIFINGVRLDVEPDDTWDSFMYRFNELLGHTNIHIPSAGGFLVTNLAGSNQRITVTGNEGLISALGLLDDEGRPQDVRGTDARISNVVLLDESGNVRPNSTSLVTHTVGNQIFVRGNHGEDIRLSIQVNFAMLMPDPDEVVWQTLPPPNDHRGQYMRPARDPAGVIIPGEYVSALIPGFVFGNNVPAPPLDDPPPPFARLDINGRRIPVLDETTGLPVVPAEWQLHDNVHPRSPMQMDMRNFGPLMIQVGPNHNNAMAVQIPRVNAETLGLVEFVAGRKRTRLNYRTMEGATDALGVTDTAISTLSAIRSRLGAYQNRLESTVRNLDVAAENTAASRSRIIDTDVAYESTRFAKFNVMFQAAMAMLGQANQRPQQVLSLLG